MFMRVQIMVHLRAQSIIYLQLHNKDKNRSPKKDVFEIGHENVYEAHFRILLKFHLKVQTDAKSDPWRREGKHALFNVSVFLSA